MTANRPRRILGNLLAEDDLARLLHATDRIRRRHRPPPGTVLHTASRMAALLRVFAREGDRLWTPAPIDPVEAPGLVLESGPLDALPPTAELLAWCETPDAVRFRAAPRDQIIDWDAPLHELVWHLPVAPPAVVAAVHHRAFHLRVAEELGCALPGARMMESLAELDRLLGTRGVPESWVVKAPLSAAGRDRHIRRKGPALSDPKERRTVERLFDRHGPLLFEPWMDRIADYGCAALLTATTLRIAGIHRQRVDLKGQFAGIELDAGLPAGDRESFLEIVSGVASALRREGYAGPFGVDAWTYRRADGRTAFHPLGEINARMTFGLVAWAERGLLPAEEI
jgi:hypothetical protein